MDGTIVEVGTFPFCFKHFTFHLNYLPWLIAIIFPLGRFSFHMTVLFSFLIRFQVLLLLNGNRVCTSLMILRHLITVIRRTIFGGGIV